MTPDQVDGDDSSQDRTREDFAIGDTVIDNEQDDPDTAVVVNRPPVAAEDWEAYQVSGEPVTVADHNPDCDPTSKVIVVMFFADLEELGVDWDGEKPLPLDEAPKGTDYAFPPARLKPVGTYSPANASETADEPPGETDTIDETAEATDEQTKEAIGADDTPEQTQKAATEKTSTQVQGTAAGDEADTNGDTPGQMKNSTDDDSEGQERLEAIADVVTELNIDDVMINGSKKAVVVEKLGEQYEIDMDGSVNADGLLTQRLQDAVADQIDT